MSTTIDSKGVVSTGKDAGIALKSPTTIHETLTVKSGSLMDLTPIVATSTITRGGIFTVSGSAALTLTVPNPASFPGTDLMVRSLSAHAHLLSSSLGTQDDVAFTDGTSLGSRIALTAAVGSSVALKSDGLSWLVTAASGTLTYATPSS